MSKAEPTAGISTARTQPVASTSGPSAASAMTALHHIPINAPSPLPLNSPLSQQAQDGRQAGRGVLTDATPVLFLTPMNGTFERKTVQVPFYPDVIRIGRQTNAKTIPTPTNGYFDSKVLSRQHAEVWADRNGKIWIRDIKSSNGTFVNGQRLSGENKDSDPHELREQDMLELGIDIVSEDQKTVVHHKVAARVEHAGFVNSLDSFVINDPSDLAGQINNPFAQGNIRRNSTPSAYNSALRGIGVTNNMALQRPQGFLLGPVNMEQVIKKLNVSTPNIQKDEI
jgi:pSer/pThr/pTyr-binding forkhead associated (FHA) protein